MVRRVRIEEEEEKPRMDRFRKNFVRKWFLLLWIRRRKARGERRWRVGLFLKLFKPGRIFSNPIELFAGKKLSLSSHFLPFSLLSLSKSLVSMVAEVL